MGDSIILDIARIPTHWNLSDPLLGARVNHGIGLTRLNSYKDFVIGLIVDETIRAVCDRNPGEYVAGVCVNHNNLILRIGSSEDSSKIRGNCNRMHIVNPWNISHNFPGDGIEDDQRVRSTMGQIQQPGVGIQVRVIESVGTTSKWDIGDLLHLKSWNRNGSVEHYSLKNRHSNYSNED
jgi:hypothetical protein